MAVVPFQSFAESSHRGIAERHVHLAESAALSGSSRLHFSMNLGSRT